jgi:hypothetical protein
MGFIFLETGLRNLRSLVPSLATLFQVSALRQGRDVAMRRIPDRDQQVAPIPVF